MWSSLCVIVIGGPDVARPVIPPCGFGPTDISDEEWSQQEILDADHAPVVLTEHGIYEVRDVGEAFLRVGSRQGRFGMLPPGSVGATRSIQILPIEVLVEPSDVLAEPGGSYLFFSTVRNATDPSLDWTITPDQVHTVIGLGVGRPNADVTTSANPAELPARLRATSAASGGLRGRPDAPPRYGEALIHTGKFAVVPGSACVPFGQRLQFEIEVEVPPLIFNSLTGAALATADPPVTWSATAGSINAEGLFTAPATEQTVTITATRLGQQETATVWVSNSCTCWYTATVTGMFNGTFAGDRLQTVNGEQGGLAHLYLWPSFSMPENNDLIFISLLTELPVGQLGARPVILGGTLFSSGHFIASNDGSFSMLFEQFEYVADDGIPGSYRLRVSGEGMVDAWNSAEEGSAHLSFQAHGYIDVIVPGGGGGGCFGSQ